MISILMTYILCNVLISLTHFFYSLPSYIKVKAKKQYINNMWWEEEMNKATGFDFKEIHPLSDKEFWVGKSAYIPLGDDDIQKCIVHVKTNLLIDYEGHLLGRYVDEELEEELPEYIKDWYSKCLNAH